MKNTIILGMGLFIIGCSNPQSNTDQNGTNNTSMKENTASSAEANSGIAAKMLVTLSGGTHTGTYNASSDEATCSMGLTGEKSFGNQYSVGDKADNEFSSLQLIVDDYEAAKAGTTKFYIKVAFGKRLVGKAYEINGSDNSIAGEKKGSGTLTVTESGGAKIATIDGKTADGVSLHTVLTCGKIIKMVNGQIVQE